MPQREREREERRRKKSNKCGGIEKREINPSLFLAFF